MKSVDIIIPIYNAFEFTKVCIEKVILHTNLYIHTLVLINDKSTDERIVPMIEGFVNKYRGKKNIRFINSKENNGFVKTVNIGMALSDNDVILLNSDTEVTAGWLEKMTNCAYSKPMVATVTPLSNNATLASIPFFCEENPIPEDFNIDRYADVIEKKSLHLYPEIPTAHGFCMLIRREALKRIGLFDDITFGKGYGEENDFSYRCLKYGYRHLLCDDTFIYHKGTQSFSESQYNKISEHLQILENKYPVQTHSTEVFVRDNPTYMIQQNAQTQILSSNGRKNILFAVHTFEDKEKCNVGGTTLHVYDLVQSLRKKTNVHVFYHDINDYYIKSFYSDYEIKKRLGNFNNYSCNNYFNTEFHNCIKKILICFNIDILHIHHTINFFLDLFDAAEELNIPTVFTLHDYYSICPKIILLDDNNKICDGSITRNCDKCLRKSSDFLYEWRNIYEKYLHKASLLVAPSNRAKKVILNVYPTLDITVIEHGYDISDSICVSSKDEDKNTFNVAIIGGISEVKGLTHLTKLIPLLKGTNITIHLFGSCSKRKYNKTMKQYMYHGPYNRDDIHRLLVENNIQLALMIQIWEETYSYTLSECFACAIPVLSFDIGAQGERVVRNDCGYVMPIESTSIEVAKKIIEISQDKTTLRRKKENILKAQKNVKSVYAMAEEYYSIYIQLIKNHPKATTPTSLDKNALDGLFYSLTDTLSTKLKIHVDLFKETKQIIKGQASFIYAYCILKEYLKNENNRKLRCKMIKKFIWYRILNQHKKNKDV